MSIPFFLVACRKKNAEHYGVVLVRTNTSKLVLYENHTTSDKILQEQIYSKLLNFSVDMNVYDVLPPYRLPALRFATRSKKS